MESTIVDTRCTVCTHKKITEIERDMVDRRPVKDMMAEYGVSKSAIYRHRTKHLASAIARHIRDGISSKRPMESIATQLMFLYGRAISTMDQCDRASDFQTSIRAQKQALSCLETFFKASETLYKISSEEDDSRDEARFRKAILDALEDHPEAKVAVSMAIGLATEES